jgi:hypothetical protein
VPREEWAVVEEGDRVLVLEDQVGRLLPGDDLTEAAVRVLGSQDRDTVRAGRGDLTRVSTSRRAMTTGRRRALVGALLPAVLVVLAAGSASAGAGVTVKTGKYSGKTAQESVNSPFNKIEFTVKKGKVTLTTEPSVAFGLCISTPVFTLDGPATVRRKGGSFTFSQTFFGTKIDKIHGKFVSSNEVEGYAIYHFNAQDLCSAGKTKVNFTAKHK